MKKILMVAFVAIPLAACSQTEQGAAIGGAGGALIGAGVGGTEGALIGGGAGLIAGALIGNAQEQGQCRYADGRGGTYIAPC